MISIFDRFSEENKGSRNPIALLQFGFGPRICIGMRLALLEMKIAMVHVLRRVKFIKTDDLQVRWDKKITTATNFRGQRKIPLSSAVYIPRKHEYLSKRYFSNVDKKRNKLPQLMYFLFMFMCFCDRFSSMFIF